MKQASLALGLAGLSFILAVIWGPPLLRILRHFNIGKSIRVEGPERHFTKLGTPTMGGVMIVVPVILVSLLMNAASLVGLTVLGRSILLPMGVMTAYAVLGAVDDWEGVRGKRRGLGMRGRTKFLIQTALALVIAIGLYYFIDPPQMYLPGYRFEIKLGYWYFPVPFFGTQKPRWQVWDELHQHTFWTLGQVVANFRKHNMAPPGFGFF